MDRRDGFLSRVWEHIGRERLSAVAAVVVLVIALIAGLVMGGVMHLGVVGAAIAVIGFVSVSRRNRSRRVVGATGVLLHFAAVALAVLLAIQLMPYGRDHSNAAVVGEPAWSSPQTRELMVNACYGCHSNEVEWPWYSNIAPVSWVVADHVDEGRAEVNYSEFVVDPGEAEETIEVILEGSMPPAYYTVFGLHPEARLTEAEVAELVAGLRLTPGMDEQDDD